mmetsp:Transcript_4340/g.10863  ORF Transcript_4340/g.10863 Transcript_4340/m.10863 type:complete len:317 (+) Transcript_4340:834-1784(+)
MIPFRLIKLGLLLIRLRCLVLGPIEERLHAEHSNDRKHLLRARQVARRQQHLGQRGVERELSHPPPKARQQPLLVQRTKRIERLHSIDERLDGGGIHEVEVNDVVDPHGLELQHSVAQIRALDLGHAHRHHLALKRMLRVQPIALPRARTPRTPRPLLRRGLRDGRHDQRIHARLGVEDLLLGEPRIHDVKDSVDRERGFGDVCGDDDLALALRGRVEDARLHLRRERGVHREDVELGGELAERLHALVQDLARRVDLLLPREEQKHVARRLREVDLHDRDERCVEIIGLGRLRVKNLDRECAAGNSENWAFVEVF